jgi:hypothetical protein
MRAILAGRKGQLIIGGWLIEVKNKQTYSGIPPFLMTSVPKSGTYLLHQILTGMPNVTSEQRRNKRFFSNSNRVDDYFLDHLKRLKQLDKNEFGVGHLYYSKKYANMLEQMNIKHIFMYRDPRDVLVSMSYYIANTWTKHSLHKDFNTKYIAPKQRFLALIHGIPQKWPDFYSYNIKYYEWLNENRSFHISYEEIMKSQESRKRVLIDLINFLWKDVQLPISKEKTLNQMISHINPTQSYTFRSGNIGSWRKEFDTEVKLAFKQNANDLLLKSGYETNDLW